MTEFNLDNLRLVRYPDPRLRRKCEEVTEFGPVLAELGHRMLEIMAASHGVGLAGPQVGVGLRVFVCNPTGEPQDACVLVNPRLSDLVGAVDSEEGCLSIPEVLVHMRRAESCRITAVDVTGAPFEMAGDGLLARVWQHENDHLDGRLIIDFMDETDRLANRKAIKHLEAAYTHRA